MNYFKSNATGYVNGKKPNDCKKTKKSPKLKDIDSVVAGEPIYDTEKIYKKLNDYDD